MTTEKTKATDNKVRMIFVAVAAIGFAMTLAAPSYAMDVKKSDSALFDAPVETLDAKPSFDIPLQTDITDLFDGQVLDLTPENLQLDPDPAAALSIFSTRQSAPKSYAPNSNRILDLTDSPDKSRPFESSKVKTWIARKF